MAFEGVAPPAPVAPPRYRSALGRVEDSALRYASSRGEEDLFAFYSRVPLRGIWAQLPLPISENKVGGGGFLFPLLHIFGNTKTLLDPALSPSRSKPASFHAHEAGEGLTWPPATPFRTSRCALCFLDQGAIQRRPLTAGRVDQTRTFHFFLAGKNKAALMWRPKNVIENFAFYVICSYSKVPSRI